MICLIKTFLQVFKTYGAVPVFVLMSPGLTYEERKEAKGMAAAPSISDSCGRASLCRCDPFSCGNLRCCGQTALHFFCWFIFDMDENRPHVNINFLWMQLNCGLVQANIWKACTNLLQIVWNWAEFRANFAAKVRKRPNLYGHCCRNTRFRI